MIGSGLGKVTRKNTFPYEVAIPSYKRHVAINEKTLATLKRYGIPASKFAVLNPSKKVDR